MESVWTNKVISFTANQLENFDVYVSEESGDFKDSTLCASAADTRLLSTSNPGLYSSVLCSRSRPLTGRYVSLVRLGATRTFLTLCDIRVIKFTGIHAFSENTKVEHSLVL